MNCLVTQFNITVTPLWPQWRLKSPASRMFTQPFIQAQIKENINFLHKWPVTRKMFPFDDVIMRPSRQSSHCIILSSFSHIYAHILHDTSSIMSFGCRPELELSTVQSTSPGIVLPINLGCSVCFTSSHLSLCREETQYLNELEPGFSTY